MSFDNGFGDVSHEKVVAFFPSTSDKRENDSKITINHMNCSVLNVPNVFICDVDVEQAEKAAYVSFFFDWYDDRPTYWEDLCFRVYETYGGFRIFLLNDITYPHSTRSKMLMDALRSDPLYARVCVFQDLYRARLTPKPARVPPGELPTSFAVAKKLFDIYDGELNIHPQVREVLEIHDSWCINSGAPLA